MLHYRNRAIEEMAGRVKEVQTKPRGSGYVERCRDYIRKHYREKIYLEDIAEFLGLSPSYLSRLFKKEAGICLQDAINEERVYHAGNLLLYSDYSLTEIAHYVGFPNQCYKCGLLYLPPFYFLCPLNNLFSPVIILGIQNFLQVIQYCFSVFLCNNHSSR